MAASVWGDWAQELHGESTLRGSEGFEAEEGIGVASPVIPRQTTVLGSRVDTLVAKEWPGHNVLDIPDWTPQKNIKWLDSAMRRGDDIYLATDPAKHRALMVSLGKRSAFTDLELPYLELKGYVQEGMYMVQEMRHLP